MNCYFVMPAIIVSQQNSSRIDVPIAESRCSRGTLLCG